MNTLFSAEALEAVDPQLRPLVASHVISVMKHVWAESWGDFMRNNFFLRSQPAFTSTHAEIV